MAGTYASTRHHLDSSARLHGGAQPPSHMPDSEQSLGQQATPPRFRNRAAEAEHVLLAGF